MLDRLINYFKKLIGKATAKLAKRPKQKLPKEVVKAWQANVEQIIVQQAITGYMVGQSSSTFDDKAFEDIERGIELQLGYFDDFVTEVQNATEWQEGWQSRAESYANAISVPYWQGRTKMLPLPAMPTEGTGCLGNCRCKWRVDALDADKGNYNAYWQLEKGSKHCQVCDQRAIEWSPLKVRGGQLLLRTSDKV